MAPDRVSDIAQEIRALGRDVPPELDPARPDPVHCWLAGRDVLSRPESDGRKGPATMPAYLISDVGAVAPEDQDAWNAYLAAAPATIARYGGRYLARGGAVDVIEGDWSPHAVVIAEFPDRAAVARWYASPEYAEALAIRAASGLHRSMICVDGVQGETPAFSEPDGG